MPADPNTSLNLLGARTYDPATGRFLTLDPIYEAGNPLAMGGYAYASNNPATNSDPTGLSCRKDQDGNSVGNCYRDTGGGGGTCTVNPAICAPTDTTSTTTTGTTSDSGTTSTGTTSQVGCSSKVQERYSGCNSTLPAPVFIGGLKSFLGGGLGSLISIADIIRCAGSLLSCPQDIATGHTYSDAWVRWLHDRGVPTGPHSQYGAGYGSFSAITLFLGLIRAPAVAAEEVVPILRYPGKSLGPTARNMARYMNDKGLDATSTFIRVGSKVRRQNWAANRRLYTGGPSMEEFPFASTAQGGPGAYLTQVSIDEQRAQGRLLWDFYRQNGIKPGDPFGIWIDWNY
jgi:RHS repeat-associated protein